MTDDEKQWAESAAKQFDALAETSALNASEWASKEPHPDSLHMALKSSVRADVWRDAARLLRHPYRVNIYRGRPDDYEGPDVGMHDTEIVEDEND